MKKSDRGKIKKQLVSGGIYIALAAAVVTVTLNGVNSIIGNSEDYVAPEINLEIPNTEDYFDNGENFLQLPETDIISEQPLSDNIPEYTVSGNSDGIVADTVESNSDVEQISNRATNENQKVQTDSFETNLLRTNENTEIADVSGEPDDIEYTTEPEPTTYDFFSKPADGYIDKEFSMDELIYSTTMGDYRTHNGVDITGDPGSEVKSINAGTVTDVYYDDYYGYTVVINHGNGISAYYMNLSKDTPPEIIKGATVELGQVIGGIGNTSSLESAEISHLHLSITKDGEFINPSNFMRNTK